MARPNDSRYEIAAVVFGVVVVVVVLIAAVSGYSLKLRGGLIEVEMHPATAQSEAVRSP